MHPKEVKIRVTPGARVARITVQFCDSNPPTEVLCVYVTERARDNKANQAVIKALAEYWSIPPSYIRIKRGLASRDKRILIHQD